MSTQASAPSLVVRTGEGEHTLAAGRAYLVGRDPQADIMVADFRVSWHHAELRPHNGRWALADLGSSNGSYADGRRADLIEIDGTRQVRLGDPEDGPLLDCTVLAPGAGRHGAGLPGAGLHGLTTRRPGTAHRPGAGQRHRGPPPQRLPAPRRAARDGGRVPHRGPGQPQRHLRQRAAGHRRDAGRGRHRRLRRHHVPAVRRRAAPDRRPGAGAGADAARARPHGRNRDRGCRGGRPRPGRGRGRGRRLAAASRPRSRTRCAGWCRGASGSRTSTS